MAKTKIEWTDAVWNPITGCTPISEGCQNCYAKRMANRLRGRYGYPQDDPFEVTFHPDRIDQPLKWKKPRRIFVCSMGDLFHKDVKKEWIDRVFQKIASSKHIYILLTKYPKRMRDYLMGEIQIPNSPYTIKKAGEPHSDIFNHIWFGVTAENQQRADERIPILLQIPEAVRFVSVEPMLGPVDLHFGRSDRIVHILKPSKHFPGYKHSGRYERKINWVILGGESGPGARPMHPDWARDVMRQCVGAGVPFFFKQWGEWAQREAPEIKDQHPNYRGEWVFNDGGGSRLFSRPCADAVWVEPVGKKAAGRLLDGREWNEAPE